MKANVLGTYYRIRYETLEENPLFKSCDGYCDRYLKIIHIRCYTDSDEDRNETTISDDALQICEQKTLRHELIHAFMYESGLDANSKYDCAWAINEEMVDWMAIQMPKIMLAYESVLKQQQN